MSQTSLGSVDKLVSCNDSKIEYIIVYRKFVVLRKTARPTLLSVYVPADPEMHQIPGAFCLAKQSPASYSVHLCFSDVYISVNTESIPPSPGPRKY